MKKLKKFFLHPSFLILLGLLLVVVVWEIVAFSTSQLFLPEFFSTCSQLVEKLGEKTTYLALGNTLLRLVASLLGSGALGMLLGTLAGYFSSLGMILTPLMTVLRSFPTIALILLLIVFVPETAIWVVSLVLFPMLYQASYSGARTIYQRYEMSLLLKGKYHLSNITRIILPLSMDYVLLGWTQALGLGLKIEIMAETFTYRTDDLGLGNLINTSYQNLDYREMMAYVLICLILILVMDFLLHLAKKRLKSRDGFANIEK